MTSNSNHSALNETGTLLQQLDAALDKLDSVVTQETALIAAGKLRDAGRLQADKSVQAKAFLALVTHIRDKHPNIGTENPAFAQALRDKFEIFQVMLKNNMAALQTARSVTRNLIQNVAKRVGKAETPNTYGYQGAMNQPKPQASQGLTLDRAL